MALTERERQILEKIEQNPMISQNDLAQWCGITRSGVAAHISNLMRKGYIQGKGYVLTPPRYVAVIGAINMDVYGIADNDVVGESSNVGSIVSAVGGHRPQRLLQPGASRRAQLPDLRIRRR